MWTQTYLFHDVILRNANLAVSLPAIISDCNVGHRLSMGWIWLEMVVESCIRRCGCLRFFVPKCVQLHLMNCTTCIMNFFVVPFIPLVSWQQYCIKVFRFLSPTFTFCLHFIAVISSSINLTYLCSVVLILL